MTTPTPKVLAAASDRKGELTEVIALDRKGRRSAAQQSADGAVTAFHMTPGYETCGGPDWAGVIIQRPT